MRKLYLLSLSMAIILLLGNYCLAKGQGYDEAKSYLLKVFNDAYVNPQNNAKIQNRFNI